MSSYVEICTLKYEKEVGEGGGGGLVESTWDLCAVGPVSIPQG